MAENLTPEELLWKALHKALLTPRGRVVVLLRLSQLPPPAPRSYHRRIALMILEEAARQHEGAVFQLGNGDALLLCRQASGTALPETALTEPASLPHTLARLFRVDVPEDLVLTLSWTLEHDNEALLAYAAQARAATATPYGSQACSPR